jgi:hypothetical protein
MMIDFEYSFQAIEETIAEAIDDADGSATITASSIATAILAPLDLPFPSELYSATHATLVELAERILKERFDPHCGTGSPPPSRSLGKIPMRCVRSAQLWWKRGQGA